MLTLIVIGLVGGLITGISPCVLPVLPAIFLAGGAQSARTSGPVPANTGSLAVAVDPEQSLGRRPFLVVAGLVVSFSVFTLLGSLILSALHLPSGVIRWAGLIVLVLLGVGMIVPRFEVWLEQPFSWIPQRAVTDNRGGFVLGLALGAVYVPCAGPVLAAITIAGATGQIGGSAVVLTLSFAVGTAIPLLIFALAGRRVAERVGVFRRHQRGIRIAAGVVVIGLAVALTFNVTDAIQRAIPDYTANLNTALNDAGATAVPQDLGSGGINTQLPLCAQDARDTLLDCGPAPDFAGIGQWFNTPDDQPLTIGALKGKVVLVDFWAYSCINCQRAIPHVQAWYTTYQNAGLEVIGVHTPEYAFEHDAGNVQSGAQRLGISYPIALDNNYATWTNYSNESWPADYLIDATGRVRHVTIGEGDYTGTESLIRQLLTAANPTAELPPATQVADTTPTDPQQTPETYLGAARAQNFAGDTPLAEGVQTFPAPAAAPDDEFSLSGTWSITKESISSLGGAGIDLNFIADDVYLDVGGTGTVTATVDGSDDQLPGRRGAQHLHPGGPAIAEPGHSAGHTLTGVDRLFVHVRLNCSHKSVRCRMIPSTNNPVHYDHDDRQHRNRTAGHGTHRRRSAVPGQPGRLRADRRDDLCPGRYRNHPAGILRTVARPQGRHDADQARRTVRPGQDDDGRHPGQTGKGRPCRTPAVAYGPASPDRRGHPCGEAGGRQGAGHRRPDVQQRPFGAPGR